MLTDLAKECEVWDNDPITFPGIVKKAVDQFGINALAWEFEVAHTTIIRWSEGTVLPSFHVQGWAINLIRIIALNSDEQPHEG